MGKPTFAVTYRDDSDSGFGVELIHADSADEAEEIFNTMAPLEVIEIERCQ